MANTSLCSALFLTHQELLELKASPGVTLHFCASGLMHVGTEDKTLAQEPNWNCHKAHQTQAVLNCMGSYLAESELLKKCHCWLIPSLF